MDSLGEINLGEYPFKIGVQFHYKRYDKNLYYLNKKIRFDIPKYVGRFTLANTTDPYPINWTYTTPFLNRTGVFNVINEELGEREQQAIKNGHCMDTMIETVIIKGMSAFETDQVPVQKLQFQFTLCSWESFGNQSIRDAHSELKRPFL